MKMPGNLATTVRTLSYLTDKATALRIVAFLSQILYFIFGPWVGVYSDKYARPLPPLHRLISIKSGSDIYEPPLPAPAIKFI